MTRINLPRRAHRISSRVAGILVLGLLVSAAEIKPVRPNEVKPAGAYTPGILTDELLYVSGQGAATPEGKLPADEDEQIRQCLRNVKAVVEAAGLRMEHVVYLQVYLSHYSSEDRLNRVWEEFFPHTPPARSVIGVDGLHGTTVEMSAVAVKDLALKKIIAPAGFPPLPFSPAVRAGKQLFVSGFSGRDIRTGSIPSDPAQQVKLALANMNETLMAAGANLTHLVFVNPYITKGVPVNVMNQVYARHFKFGNTPARATIEVAGLPDGANVQFTGIAVTDLSERQAVRPKNMEPSPTASPCVFAGKTLYCSAKSGFIPGVNGGIYASTVETQLRQTMRNLLDGLEEAGMNFSNVVAANVYLNNIADFAAMNSIYAQYFGPVPPARTTVQQIAPINAAADAKGHWPTLEQISLVAVK